jgi:hypothetical protein
VAKRENAKELLPITKSAPCDEQTPPVKRHDEEAHKLKGKSSFAQSRNVKTQSCIKSAVLLILAEMSEARILCGAFPEKRQQLGGRFF